jgi:hypothetical protein
LLLRDIPRRAHLLTETENPRPTGSWTSARAIERAGDAGRRDSQTLQYDKEQSGCHTFGTCGRSIGGSP